jgi:hypothetical protein
VTDDFRDFQKPGSPVAAKSIQIIRNRIEIAIGPRPARGFGVNNVIIADQVLVGRSGPDDRRRGQRGSLRRHAMRKSGTLRSIGRRFRARRFVAIGIGTGFGIGCFASVLITAAVPTPAATTTPTTRLIALIAARWQCLVAG